MKEKINLLREKLHYLLKTKFPNDIEIVEVSQELDKLILEYYYDEKNLNHILANTDQDGWFFTDIGI